MLKSLDGYKTYIVAALVAIVTGLDLAGVIDPEMTAKIYGGLAALGLYTVREGITKSGPVAALLACMAFGLSAPQPASAGKIDPPPNFQCAGGACNFYLVSGGWSPHSKQIYVGGNAVEFLSGTFGVGMTGVGAGGDINFIGGVCLIPKVKDALAFLCPQPVQ